jgi:hypothetical protein
VTIIGRLSILLRCQHWHLGTLLDSERAHRPAGDSKSRSRPGKSPALAPQGPRRGRRLATEDCQCAGATRGGHSAS